MADFFVLISGKHHTNRFSALLMEQPMAARKSLPQRQMEQRAGDVKVDTAGVMTTTFVFLLLAASIWLSG